MMLEHSNLTTGAQLVAETLREQYGIEPGPLFASVGLDARRLHVAGARYPAARLVQLWHAAVAASSDPCFGLAVGARVRITTFHAIGYSWLASRNLEEALQRLQRYYRLLSTSPVALRLEPLGPEQLRFVYSDDAAAVHSAAATIDAFTLAVLKLCRVASGNDFRAQQVSFRHPDHGRAGEFVEAFGAPVVFDADHDGLVLDRADLVLPLPGENAELAHANDQVAERYLAALEPQRVATAVRELLVDMLPSGDASQQAVANRLNRSLSTLQRQLQAEGMSFQKLRDETRQRLAEDYIRESQLSLAEVAYLLGFSDQSNFSRAFRRWTGYSPREFRSL
jgi:AraC-like DNA-binding protein